MAYEATLGPDGWVVEPIPPTSGGAVDLDGLTDVEVAAPSTGQVLKFNGTEWVNDTDATGGGGVTDGDKGDIVVSGGGVVWGLDSAVVTAAARTVLDDSTVAAMVNTLGGATASGTGGIARVNGPTFTGTPAAPTAAAATNTTQIATTAFVRTELANLVDSSPGALDTLNELAAALGDDPNFAATMTTALAGKANTSHTQAISTITGLQDALDDKLDAAIATDITDTKAAPVGADQSIVLDSAASGAPKLMTFDGQRTLTPGTALATTGTVNLDMAANVGVPQNITMTGNITFTTSNRATGRLKELRLVAGGSTRTLAWPAGWVAYGAALPVSLASGKVLRVAIFCNGTADSDIDATSALSV